MTQVDFGKVQASSLSPGLQDLGTIPDVSTTYSGTIPAKTYNTTSLTIPFTRPNIISLMKINITGIGLDTLWFPLQGAVTILQPQFKIVAVVSSSSAGRVVNVYFVNMLNNAPVTVSPLTINVHTHLYNYPW